MLICLNGAATQLTDALFYTVQCKSVAGMEFSQDSTDKIFQYCCFARVSRQ